MRKAPLFRRLMAIILMLAIFFSDSSIAYAVDSVITGTQTSNYSDENDEVWSFVEASGYGSYENLPLYLKDNFYKELREMVPRVRGNGDGTITVKWNPVANAKSYSLTIIDDSKGKYERVVYDVVNGKTYCTFPMANPHHGPFYFHLSAESADNKEIKTTGWLNLYFPGNLNYTPLLGQPSKIEVSSTSSSATIKFKKVSQAKDYTIMFDGKEYKVETQANNYGWHEFKINNLKENQTYSYAIRPNYYSKIGVYTAILPRNTFKSVPGEYGETYTLITDHESIGSIKVTNKTATETSITVSWSGAANAKVFDLVVDGKRYTTTDWSKTVTGLTPGRTYNVYVVAKNDYKTNISDTYEIKTPPKAPSGVVVTPGENSARINWNKAEGAGHYELQYSVDGKQYTPTTEGTSYTITGLKPNTKYSVKIRCGTRDGKGEYGNAVSFTTGKAAPITTAPSLSSSSAGAYSADIKWTTVSGAASYELLFNSKTYTTSYNYYNVPSLTPGTTYKYKIRGKNEGSTGPYSSEYSITIPPNPPENLNSSASETSVTLSWNKVDGATGYIVNFNGTTKTYSGDVTSATYTGLVADTTYNCSIACKNEYGTGSYRGWGYVKTLKESQPLSIPEAEIYATDKSVTLEWKAVAGATKYELEANDKKYTTTGLRYTITGLSPNTSYYIKLVALNDKYKRDNLYSVRTAPSAPAPSATATNDSIRIYWSENYDARGYTVRFDGVDYETNQTSMTFSGLQTNTAHTYAVCSHGSYGHSEFSPTYTISTKNMFEDLSAPTGISKKIIARDRAMISWDEVPYADRYEIEINGNLYSLTKNWGNFELPYGKTSYFRIRAVGKTSVSPYTSMNTFKMPPKGPSNVTATSTHNSITLRWNPVPGAEGYIINNTYEIGPSQTTYTLTGLNADREYYYYVGCNTEDGHLTSEGAYYEGIIKTKTLSLDVPTGIVDTTDETTFTLTWNPVKNADSYVVEINGVTWDVTKPKLYVPGYKNGTQLKYRVAAKGAGVTGPFSAMMTTYTAYPAPMLCSPTLNTDNSVTFAWYTDSRCTGYELWINGKTYSFSAETSNFKLENATGEPLTYKIRSKYKNSYSKYSAEKVVYPYAMPVKNIRADVGDRYIDLFWNPSPGADHYIVVMNSPEFRSWSDRNVRTCEYHYTDLRDSAQYNIEIYPVNSKGQMTNTVYPLTVRTKLGPPYLLDSKPVRVGTDFVELNWYESWGGKSYEIVFDGKKYQTTGTQYRITGLEPGTKHTYKMCSINGNERSRYTEEHEIETLPLPLKAPTNITAEASATDVLISWEDLSDATGYVVNLGSKQFNVTNSPLRIKALEPYTDYSFTIRTKNQGGVGPESEPVSFTTKLAAPVVSDIDVKGSNIEISVNRVKGAERYVFVIDGNEYRTEDPYIILANLEPHTEYQFSVYAENDRVTGESTSRSFTTGSLCPDVPSDITATKTRSNITLYWPAVEGATSYDIVFSGTSYHVEDSEATNSNGATTLKADSINTYFAEKKENVLSSLTLDRGERNVEEIRDFAAASGGISTSQIIVNPKEVKEHILSQNFPRLLPGTVYTYKMRANNAFGSSEYTELVSISTDASKDETCNSDYNYDVTDSVRTYLDGKKNYTSGDPIDVVTGAFLWSTTVVEDHGADDLHFDIMYKSNMSKGINGGTHEMGQKWSHNFNYTIKIESKNVYFTNPYDETVAFVKKGNVYKNMTEGDKTTFAIDSEGRRIATTEDGTAYYFDKYSRLTQITKDGKPVYTFTFDSKKKIMTVSTQRSAQIQIAYSSGRVSSVKDSLGNTTKFTYTGSYLSKITNPQSASMQFEYEEGGKLSKIIGFDGEAYLTNTYDENGRVVGQKLADRGEISATYDDDNRINKFTDEFGNVTTYMYDETGRIIYVGGEDKDFVNEYNDKGQIVKQTDPEGNITETTYDAKGRICKIVYPDGTFEETVYGENGKPSFVKGRDGLSVFYEYDANGNIKKYTDKSGNSCEYLYDAFGNLITYTDFEGNEWNYEYDTYSHLSKAIDPEGNVREFTYDRAGRITSYTSPTGGSTGYEYSASGQLLKVIEEDGTTEYSYDVNGNVSEIKDKKGNVESYQYDGMGNVVKKTDPLGNSYCYKYDDAGRLINTTYPDGWIDDYFYDSFGNISTYKDPVGYPTDYKYDKNGRLIEKKDALGGVISYEYDSMGQTVAVTDSMDHVTSYTYDNAGRVLSITDPLGYVVSYDYDANGNITSETDKDGNVINYEYDKENRLIKKTDSVGSETMSYDKAGNLVSVEDKAGKFETYAYDSDGNVIEYTDKCGNKTAYSYDAYGRLVSETAPNGAVTQYTYDENNNYSSVTDAENHKATYVFNANNQISEYTDALGNKTLYAYDTLGRIMKETDPNGNVTSYWYDGNGNLASVTNAVGGMKRYSYDKLNRCISVKDEMEGTWSYEYDAAGNKISYTDPKGYTVRFKYDANNRLTDVTNAAKASIHYEYTKTDKISSVTDEEGAVTSYEYDALGRVSKISDALGNSTSFTYDANDNILSQTDANGNTRSYTYSPEGNLLTETDPEGNITSYAYDSVGLLIARTDANENTTRYEYNKLGQPVSITDALGNRTEFSYTADGYISEVKNAKGDSIYYFYDACGNIVKTTDELGNSTCYEYDAINNCIKEYVEVDGEATCVTLYEYDRKGRRIKEITPLQETKSYGYDAKDNLTDYVDEEGRRTEVWYDLNGNPELKTYSDGTSVGYRYNKRGELVKLTDWNGETVFERDILGRITNVTEFDGQTVGYSYDAVGNTVKIEYPDGKTVSYGYDRNNRIKSVTDAENVVGEYSYDRVGNIVQFNQSGSSTIYEYNSANLPVKATYKTGDNIDGIEEYSYDELGSIISHKRTFADLGINEVNLYSYDAKGQLISASKGINTEEYTYDAFGNRLTKLVNGSDLTTYSYNAKNQLISKSEGGHAYTYVYDKCGNLLREDIDGVSAVEYAYNAEGKLVIGINNETNEQTAYSYNALGMMVSNTKTYQSIEASILEELDTDILPEISLPDSEIVPDIDISDNDAQPEDETSSAAEEETSSDEVVPETEDISGNEVITEPSIIPEVPEISETPESTENPEMPEVPIIPDVSGGVANMPEGTSAIYVSSVESILPEMPSEESVSVGDVSEGDAFEAIEQPTVDVPVMEDISGNQQSEDEILLGINNEELSDAIIISEDLENINIETEILSESLVSAVPTIYSVRNVNDYLSDAYNALCEINSDGTVVRNVYGNRYQLLARETADGYLTVKSDIYLTPFSVTDTEGSIVSAGFKDVWGNGDATVGEMPWFTSYTYDEVIGKYFAHARFYDPVNGRMLSLDPVKRNLNGYIYCDDDPVNKTDDDGEIPAWLVTGTIGSITRGLSGIVESYVSQIGNGKSFAEKTKAALAHGAGEAIKGFASGATLLTSRTPLGVTVNAAAGALGDAVEQYIATGTVDLKQTIKSGATNAAREAIYGGGCLKNLGNAMLKGGVAKATENALDYAIDAAAYGISHAKEEAYRPVSYDSYYNPAYGCASSDSFDVGYGSIESRGYGSVSENPYSLKGFAAYTLKGALEGAGESAAFYGLGKLFESAKSVVACFTAGTYVLTTEGLVGIETIKEGDEVYACNIETGETGLKKVKQTYVHEVTELVHVTIDGEQIDTTREHPFYVEGEGFLPAGELRKGDVVKSFDNTNGIVEAVEIESLITPVKVYNFEVEDWHTYFVGENEMLVHNKCGENVPQRGSEGELKQLYNSIKESANYPEGFEALPNGTTRNRVNNLDLLDELRKVESGNWKKVYKDGFDGAGNKISIHYFQSESGKVFNVKIKKGWSN